MAAVTVGSGVLSWDVGTTRCCEFLRVIHDRGGYSENSQQQYDDD